MAADAAEAAKGEMAAGSAMAVDLLIWKFTRPSDNPEEISNLLVNLLQELFYSNYYQN